MKKLTLTILVFSLITLVFCNEEYQTFAPQNTEDQNMNFTDAHSQRYLERLAAEYLPLLPDELRNNEVIEYEIPDEILARNYRRIERFYL